MWENRLMRTIPVTLLLLAAGAVVTACAKSSAPKEGAPAPAFTLNTQEGKPIALSDLRGQWVVLYFYPKDFTSGCTIEAHEFQEDLKEYEKRDAVVLGVSVQSEGSHKDFCAKEGLNFKLLADVDRKVSQAYGSLMGYKGLSLSARNTFVIDPHGVIRRAFLKVRPSGHSREVLAALDDLRKPGASK
jgi:peroxiredoxin Q/BCP